MVGVYYFNFLIFIFYFSYIVPADDDMTIFKKCQEQNIQYIVFHQNSKPRRTTYCATPLLGVEMLWSTRSSACKGASIVPNIYPVHLVQAPTTIGITMFLLDRMNLIIWSDWWSSVRKEELLDRRTGKTRSLRHISSYHPKKVVPRYLFWNQGVASSGSDWSAQLCLAKRFLA